MKTRLAAAVCALVLGTVSAQAADRPWTEVKGQHFVVVTDGGERGARTVLWQFEQIRAAIQTIWPWARADMDRPLLVLLVNGENGMRALAPQYWEQKGAAHPASLFVTGVDRHYIALRADVQVSQRDVNPYMSAYWSYFSLLLRNGLKADLPPWLSRGLANVMSNTIVLDSSIEVGRIVPWYLRELKSGLRHSVAEIVAVERESTTLQDGEKLARFDADAWALVHYLMFGDNGSRVERLNRFMSMLAEGRAVSTAMDLSLGSAQELDKGFQRYTAQEVFMFSKVQADMKIRPEGFTTRTTTVAETASTRAAFHAAVRRPVEARADAEAARQADPKTAADVEGIVAEADGKTSDAIAAYGRAVDANSTSFYSYYRWAVLSRRGATDPAVLEHIDQALQRAVALNANYAPAFQMLAEVKLQAGKRDDALAAATRSITLDPAPPSYHATMARVLSALGRHDEAVRQARDAFELSKTDSERRFAQQLIDSLSGPPKARGASPEALRPSAANGVTMPKLVHEEKPGYTAEALKQKISGSVLVECVVGIDGSVQSARIVRSLDKTYGLDEEALSAARAWRFEPGTRNGVAVPVIVTIELTFAAK